MFEQTVGTTRYNLWCATFCWRSSTAPDPQSEPSASFFLTPECCCTRSAVYPGRKKSKEHSVVSDELTPTDKKNNKSERNKDRCDFYTRVCYAPGWFHQILEADCNLVARWYCCSDTTRESRRGEVRTRHMDSVTGQNRKHAEERREQCACNTLPFFRGTKLKCYWKWKWHRIYENAELNRTWVLEREPQH